VTDLASSVLPRAVPFLPLTVYTLLVGKSLRLLSLVPVENQAVSEGEGRAGVGGGLIAVVQGAGEGGLDVADGLFLELFGGREGLRELWESVNSRSWSNSANWTIELLPHPIRPIGTRLTCFLQASLWGSGILASTLLISPGPNPVTVRLCLGLVKFAGPTGPLRSASGALMEGRRSRAGADDAVAILEVLPVGVGELLRASRC
jgi:hypothetical protein